MKKFTLSSIASFCLLSIANAQITKGSFFIGVSLGFSKNKNEATYPQQLTSIQENEKSSWSFRVGIKLIS